jgi:hypothetical protein
MISMSTYTTKKQRYPGSAVLDAEFAAVATPEQLALVESVAQGTWADIDAGVGIWGYLDLATSQDVVTFHRATGAVEVAR